MKLNSKEIFPLILALLVAVVLRLTVVTIYKIPTDSMSPTFLMGDYILGSKAAYGLKFPWSKSSILSRSPAKGDLVVVSFKERPTMSYVRRIMGLPGDSVEINGKLVVLGANQYFVLSDNVNSKDDSRYLGPVELDQIESQAKLIWFSISPESKIRWGRIFSLL